MLLTLPSLTTISPPMLGIPGVAVTGMQALATATFYSNELNPKSRGPYSKFYQGDQNSREIPSRRGMTIIYGMPFVTAIAASLMLSASPAGCLLVAHFMKRLLEVQFVHQYSGSMAREAALPIGTYYSLLSLLIISVATTSPETENLFYGLGLFVVGTLGNLYHHMLLARLRQCDNNDKEGNKYVVPSGGLFDYAAAPHYFFELLAWLGIGLTAQHGNALLVVASMTSYLSGRAVSQNQWNRQTFGKKEWPESRYNMIPFVF